MLGILGGVFDPIHFGHLSATWQVYQHLNLSELRLMPCHRPPHRAAPIASNEDRLNMLALAVQDIPGFVIDKRELISNDISYTFNSLTAIRKEMRDTPICLIIGQDALNQIDTWHQAEQLITLAHLVVMKRPDEHIEHNRFIDNLLKHRTDDPTQLRQKNAGYLYFISNPSLGISSTLIRQIRADALSPRFLLPDTVLHYIEEKQLYL